MKATVDLTDSEKDALVGGSWNEPYPIPDEDEFDEAAVPGRLAADDLEAMTQRLIGLDRLRVGHLANFTIRVIWMKSGGSAGGQPTYSHVSLASADDRFFATERVEDDEDDGRGPFDAKIRVAADNLRDREATRWFVGNEIAGCLCRLRLLVTKKTGAKRLIVVAPEASYSYRQMDVFGPLDPPMKRQMYDIKQQAFDWAERLSEADFEESDDDDESYDPTIGQPAGVDEELGPVDGGAPEADWAEPIELKACPFCGEKTAIDRGDVAATCGQCGKALFPVEESNDDTHDDAPWSDVAATMADHIERVRVNFGTYEIGGEEFCERCGVLAANHDPEVCQGGTPATRQKVREKSPKNRDGAKGSTREESAIIGESPVLSHYSASNGNGHAADDFDTTNRDPQLTVRTLREAGRQIVWEDGQYRHPSGVPVYSSQWVEGELRTIKNGATA